MKNYLTLILLVVLSISASGNTADPQDHSTWNITPQNYQYSMMVTAVLIPGNTESRDVTDSISAFAGEDCRGVAGPVTYVPETDRYLVNLIIYSNSPSGEIIKLYMYDNDKGEIINVAQELEFAASVIYGSPQDPYIVFSTFSVEFLVTAGMDTISGAEIFLGSNNSKISNDTGLVVFENIRPDENINYTVITDKYDTFQDSLSLIDSDISELIALTVSHSFSISDGKLPVAEAVVILDGYESKTADEEGYVIFSQITPSDTIKYGVSCDSYDNYEGMISASFTGGSDTVSLILTTYDVILNISNNGSPLSNATVALSGYGSIVTSADGVALFNNVIPEENISYTVEVSSFDPVLGDLTVRDSSIEQNIFLVLTAYDILFSVVDGDLPVENATVNLDGYGSNITDINGKTIFEQVPLSDSINYTISHEIYDDFSDSVAVINGIVFEKSRLTLSRYSLDFSITFGGQALEDAIVAINLNGGEIQEDASTVELPDEIRISRTDADGIAHFSNILPSDTITYKVSSTDYLDNTGYVSIGQASNTKDIEMIHLYNIYFSVLSSDSWGANPLSGVVIQLERYGQQITDHSGNAMFAGITPENNLAYIIYLDEGKILEDAISIIDSDETVSVSLAPEEVLIATNFVSPNADGYNDYWEIDNAERYASYTVCIFSSAGEIVFETTQYHTNKWDGTYKGRSLPEGVYYYILRNESGEIQFRGLINLLN